LNTPPQNLSYRLSANIARYDLPTNTLINHYIRMINRDVSRALIEVSHRIATSLHDFFDQPVGFAKRFGRLVYEARLDFSPSFCETALFSLRKRPNLQLPNAFLTRSEFSFSFAGITIFPGGVLVFGSEL